MSDTPTIEPVFTPEEWEDPPDLYDAFVRWEADGLPKIIAAANAALPDSDPRKITRAWVETIRDLVAIVKRDEGDPDVATAERRGSLLADALESYLPPES